MASRKEQKEALRQERLEREQKAAQAAARKRVVGIVVAAILVLGIAGALAAVLLAGGDDGDGGGTASDGGAAQIDFPDEEEGAEIPDQKEADLAVALKGSGCKEEEVQAEGAGQHVTEPVTYVSEPPAVGPHAPDWPEDQLFEEAPQTERVAHTLEHGRVLVWVRPDASEELAGQLRSLYDEDPYHVIMLPRKELKEPVAVSAWEDPNIGHILRCNEVNDKTWDAIRSFKEKYRDKGPEFVP